MSAPANLRLSLANTLDDVAIATEALAGLVAWLGLDALAADDLRTAVAEVCKNVVHHAYEGGEGPLTVSARALAGAVEVVVCDDGAGIHPHVGERTQPHTGLGLPIVHSLTDSVTFTKLPGGGTEVRMCFSAPGVVETASAPVDEGRSGSVAAADPPRDGCFEIVCAPSAVARAVLGRVLVGAAAQASSAGQLTVPARTVGDAVAELADDRLGGGVHVCVARVPGALELRVAPLADDAAHALLEAVADAAAHAGTLEADTEAIDAGTCTGAALTLRLVAGRQER